MMKLALKIVVLAASVAMADEPKPFVFVKTGEKFATQEDAGPTVSIFTGYLGQQIGGTTNAFAPRLFNDPAKAIEFCNKATPPLGIVTPGFFLTYGKTLGLEPLLETRRDKIAAERYVLVASKDAPDDAAKFAGMNIATPLAAEQRYVIGVILQDKLGREIRLQPAKDVEGAVFDIVEKSKNAAAAVLMEESAWKLFEADAELGPKLKVVFRSDELPRDLVVVFTSNAGGVNVEKLKSALKQMTASDDGKTMLRSIRVEAFVDVEKERLAKALVLFQGK